MTPNGEIVDLSLRHVVMLSSGVGSAVAAKRVADLFGTDNLTLLFADVNMEHPDNYRFLREAHGWIGGELVILDNAGKDIWDVFRAQRFLGNTRVDLCSRVLKREPMRAWLEANCDPTDTVVHLGFDISEEHRIVRAAPHWVPWAVDAPLCWEPVVWKDQAIAWLASEGIEAPLLTRQGFPHANCGGGCVKAGIGQFTKLYHLAPDTYAEWEREEQGMRDVLDADVSILRDRTYGVVRTLTLAELRRRIESKGSLFDLLDADEGDSCNCMGDYEGEPVAVSVGVADVPDRVLGDPVVVGQNLRREGRASDVGDLTLREDGMRHGSDDSADSGSEARDASPASFENGDPE